MFFHFLKMERCGILSAGWISFSGHPPLTSQGRLGGQDLEMCGVCGGRWIASGCVLKLLVGSKGKQATGYVVQRGGLSNCREQMIPAEII